MFFFIFAPELKFTNTLKNKTMETPGMNEAITALVTAAIAAIVRYFEKKRMAKDQDTTNHFKR